MVKAMDLADYAVYCCTVANRPISNLHLQKMLYFLQSIYCRNTGKLLFPEAFSAWPYGPVIPEIYDKYSAYGGRAIIRHESKVLAVRNDIKQFVDAGIDILSKQSPWDLVKTTHAPGSPWDRVYQDGKGYKKEIPNEYIIEASETKRG